MGTTAVLSKPPLLNEYMTGRHRFRSDVLAGLVFQLEFSIWKDHRWVCEYRDATEKDLKARGDTIV